MSSLAGGSVKYNFSSNCVIKLNACETVPGFEAFQSFFNPLLVVLCHVHVHVGVVAADVPLCAPVWNRPEAKRRVMLMRFLEL